MLAAAVPSAAIAAGTPAPARTAPPEPAARSNSAAIQDVLNHYRDAFNTLDLEAARTVWPSADAKALGRAFASLEEQGLVLQTCRIDVNGARAVALCGGTLRYVPKHGNKTARVEQRQWEFTLREVAERWSIDSVDAR